MKRHMPRHAVEQPLDPSYRIIALSQGKDALVSTRHYEKLIQWNWSAEIDRKGRTFYAVRRQIINGKSTRILMHRFILNDYTSPHIDHQNGNGLDNRDGNIRAATISQNGANCPKRSHNTTGYKGVVRHGKKFISSITVMGRKIRSSPFLTAEEAAQDYDKQALRYFEEFAQLNFPSV